MPKTLTIEMLKKHTEGTVRLPLLSEKEGEDVEIRYQWIGAETYLSFSPPAPPGSERWIDRKAIAALPKEQQEEAQRTAQVEFAERAQRWFDSLPEEVRLRREEQARDVLARVVAHCAIEPRLTLNEARGLGPDGEVAAYAILRASGLIRPVAEPAPVAEEAPAAVLERAA